MCVYFHFDGGRKKNKFWGGERIFAQVEYWQSQIGGPNFFFRLLQDVWHILSDDTRKYHNPFISLGRSYQDPLLRRFFT